MTRTWSSRALAAIVAAGMLMATGEARAGEPAVKSNTPAAQPSGDQKVLLDGAELFEQLTEQAPALKEAGAQAAFARLDALQPKLSKALAPAAAAKLRERLAQIREQWARGDRLQVSLASVEGYRLLQEAVRGRRADNPLELSLLDYAGFKLRAHAQAAKPDWAVLSATAADAAGWWRTLEPRVRSRPLREAMGHALKGAVEAVAQQDARFAAFAADQELILVDALEADLAHPMAAR